MFLYLFLIFIRRELWWYCWGYRHIYISICYQHVRT